MEDIQFVLEAPHLTQGHKKRPRLVTSCDNCRLKKVKCIQTTPNTQCEACTLARIPCRFKDREKYFAERRRIMAGAGSSDNGRRTSSTTPESQLESWIPASSPNCGIASSIPHYGRSSPATVYDSDAMSRSSYSATPPQQHRPRSGSAYSPTMTVPMVPSQHWAGRTSYHNQSPSLPSYRSYNVSSETSHSNMNGSVLTTNLFDPEQPERPNTMFMGQLIQDFFNHLSSYFPFLNYDEVVQKFLTHSLSSLMANCIAALAARYTNLPEVKQHGVSVAVDAYSTNAETILASIIHGPSIDNLHALILLSWVEFKRSRSTAFCAYAQMAVQMALDVGLSNDKFALSSRSEQERHMLQATWASVSQLNTTANSMRL